LKIGNVLYNVSCCLSRVTFLSICLVVKFREKKHLTLVAQLLI